MIEIKKQTYSEQVADHIRQGILNGEYKPGDQIKEVVLAARLSISRAPIREALQILSQEGLIVSEPQKGKHVTALTAKEIKDSYFTGGVLEAAAVARALPDYAPEDIRKLEEIVDAMKHVADQGLPVEHVAELDNRFHRVLFSRVDNALLVELCRRSCQGISKFLLFRHWIKLFPVHEIHMRHQAILDAVRSGEPLQLEACIRKHYIDAGEKMAYFGVDVYQP